MGVCPKIHKEKLKADFEAVRDTHPRKVEYTEDMLKYCKRLVSDMQTKIKRSRERLKASRLEQAGRTQEEQEEIEGRVTALTERINKLVSQAEAAGIAGDLGEAQESGVSKSSKNGVFYKA